MTAAQQFNDLPASCATDADFRAYVAKIHAAIVACGMVNTTDTGQIDPTTVTKPSAINTWVGYKIYRFNDALQSTDPIFIRVEFGVGTSLPLFSIRHTVGTATDGSGNITGYASIMRATSMRTAASSAVNISYASHPDGAFHLHLYADNANDRVHGFAVSRVTDDTGARVSGPKSGVIIHTHYNTGGTYHNGETIEHVRFAKRLIWSYQTTPYIVPAFPVSSAPTAFIDPIDSKQVIFPVWVPSTDRLFPPIPDYAAVGTGQGRFGMEFDADWHGVTKHYKCVGQLGCPNTSYIIGNFNQGQAYGVALYCIEWPLS